MGLYTGDVVKDRAVVDAEYIEGFGHRIRLVIYAVDVVDRHLGEFEVRQGVEDCHE